MTKQRGDWALHAVVDSQDRAEVIQERARGEAVVRVMPKIDARISPRWLQRKHDVLEPGMSIGHYKITAGTLGAVLDDGELLLNNHVGANVNEAEIGDPILHPGPADGGRDVAGILTWFEPISFTIPNLVDAATARVREGAFQGNGWNAATGSVKSSRRITADDYGREVTKIGRTTGVEVGHITAVEVDGLPIAFGNNRTARFNDQFEVSGGPRSDFSQGGDSGSLVLTRDGVALGLLFAGGEDSTGEDFTYCNYITNVLDAVGKDLMYG